MYQLHHSILPAENLVPTGIRTRNLSRQSQRTSLFNFNFLFQFEGSLKTGKFMPALSFKKKMKDFDKKGIQIGNKALSCESLLGPKVGISIFLP